MSQWKSDAAVMGLVTEGWNHLKLERPLAAWASFQRALVLDPEAQAAAQALAVLSSSNELPPPALAVYTLRASAADRLIDVTDLNQAASAFEDLCKRQQDDPALWYNQGLCLAWLGRNTQAIACLERSLTLDAASCPERGREAWILAEVLRQGAGAEALADDWQYSFVLDWPEDEIQQFLNACPELSPVQLPLGAAEVLGGRSELTPYRWVEPDLASCSTIRNHLATIYLGKGRIRVSSPRRDFIERMEERLTARFNLDAAGLSRESRPLPLAFLDAPLWMFELPAELDPDRARELKRDHIEDYFENLWIHERRHSLDGRSPLAAARETSPILRVKLEAVVRYRELIADRRAARALYEGYPFDRLRRRLGLRLEDQDAVDPHDLACAPSSQLQTLDPETLDHVQRLEAARSALGLRDQTLADRFR